VVFIKGQTINDIKQVKKIEPQNGYDLIDFYLVPMSHMLKTI